MKRPRKRSYRVRPGRKPKSKQPLRHFMDDFEPMEQAIDRGVTFPAERMIVELGLNLSRIRKIEQETGISFHWFGPVFAAMKRHGLVPTTRSWDQWLKDFNRAKRAATKKLVLP